MPHVCKWTSAAKKRPSIPANDKVPHWNDFKWKSINFSVKIKIIFQKIVYITREFSHYFHTKAVERIRAEKCSDVDIFPRAEWKRLQTNKQFNGNDIMLQTACKLLFLKQFHLWEFRPLSRGGMFTLNIDFSSFSSDVVILMERNKHNSLLQIGCACQTQRGLLNDVHPLCLRQMTQIAITADSTARLDLAHHLGPQ